MVPAFRPRFQRRAGGIGARRGAGARSDLRHQPGECADVLGRAREAKWLYQIHKGQPIQKGGKLWEAAILEDFKEFEKRGLETRADGGDRRAAFGADAGRTVKPFRQERA